jgi:hypothetical protein
MFHRSSDCCSSGCDSCSSYGTPCCGGSGAYGTYGAPAGGGPGKAPEQIGPPKTNGEGPKKMPEGTAPKVGAIPSQPGAAPSGLTIDQ